MKKIISLPLTPVLLLCIFSPACAAKIKKHKVGIAIYTFDDNIITIADSRRDMAAEACVPFVMINREPLFWDENGNISDEGYVGADARDKPDPVAFRYRTKYRR